MQGQAENLIVAVYTFSHSKGNLWFSACSFCFSTKYDCLMCTLPTNIMGDALCALSQDGAKLWSARQDSNLRVTALSAVPHPTSATGANLVEPVGLEPTLGFLPLIKSQVSASDSSTTPKLVGHREVESRPSG